MVTTRSATSTPSKPTATTTASNGKSRTPSTTSKRPLKPLQSRSPKTQYLILYNAISGLGWAIILGRLILINYFLGYEYVHDGLGQFLKWHQSLAALEVVHSLFGIVPSPWFTTAVQVGSRYGLVWNVVYFFPWLARSPIYTSMIGAWSIAEIFKYSYFVALLSGYQFYPLTWLRYSAFLVLYPIGISSEAWLIWKATGPSQELHPLLAAAQWALLIVYPPLACVMYGHMLKQRGKVLRGKKEERGLNGHGNGKVNGKTH